MKNLRINHPAVIILTVAYQLMAMAWYGIFAQQWMSLNNFTEADFTDQSPVPYIYAIITALITNYAFAVLFKKLKVEEVGLGIKVAALCWLGFTFAEISTINMFSLNPFALSLVDGGKSFLAFVISGIVLASWKKYEK